MGKGAQEENLYRRTNISTSTLPNKDTLYPIPRTGLLYSSNVTILRGPEENGYPFISPRTVDIISCTAVREPRLTPMRQYECDSQRETMRAKVSLILDAAARSGCEHLVLSAFGCGAYQNPPEEVAQLFFEEIPHFPLNHILSCIRQDHNNVRAHNPYGNLAPFVQRFCPINGRPQRRLLA